MPPKTSTSAAATAAAAAPAPAPAGAASGGAAAAADAPTSTTAAEKSPEDRTAVDQVRSDAAASLAAAGIGDVPRATSTAVTGAEIEAVFNSNPDHVPGGVLDVAMDADGRPGIRVVSRPPSFRRAGREFTSEPVEIPMDELTEEQYAALATEPNLVVTNIFVGLAPRT